MRLAADILPFQGVAMGGFELCELIPNPPRSLEHSPLDIRHGRMRWRINDDAPIRLDMDLHFASQVFAVAHGKDQHVFSVGDSVITH